ncbi:competence protein CoiA family protein [Filomicrobium sp.]|uniref:competence protein CoiA n=1 Tax=Filomicrobium sp. TaxID=2024831 RepID=UPI00258F273E|nr:competence protein CoiA family protein [Filomicrobium sp.]MCV0370502.1 competence protein [Filomicrobium sp.]
MRYALVDGQREEARPGLVGICPRCEEPVIAKCGPLRVWHWSHRGKRTCDVWWEPETEWHLGWKNRFPQDWQEIVHHSNDGEKHIADVKTPLGLVMEFQHSFLDIQERNLREAFYRNIVWVVDGKRRKRDRKRFFDALKSSRQIGNAVFLVSFVEEGLPREWLSCAVPVYFDFGDDNEPGDPFPIVSPVVWCLLPRRAMARAVIVAINKTHFVSASQRGDPVFDGNKLISAIEADIRRRQSAEYAAFALQQRLKKRPRRYPRF